MTRRWRRSAAAGALVITVLVIVLVVQWLVRWESHTISEVWVTSDKEIAVLGHCHDSARVEVDATASAILLDLQTRGEAYGDCLDGVVVQLDEALGDRALIDASIGALVPVICAADGNSCGPPPPP